MGKRRKAGTFGLAIFAAMAMLFAAFMLALPLAGAWEDGTCAASAPHREVTISTQSHSVWPPGTRCRYVGGHGRTVERFVDVGRWEPLKWPVLALLVAAPLTLAAGLVASIRELHAGRGAPQMTTSGSRVRSQTSAPSAPG